MYTCFQNTQAIILKKVKMLAAHENKSTTDFACAYCIGHILNVGGEHSLPH